MGRAFRPVATRDPKTGTLRGALVLFSVATHGEEPHIEALFKYAGTFYLRVYPDKQPPSFPRIYPSTPLMRARMAERERTDRMMTVAVFAYAVCIFSCPLALVALWVEDRFRWYVRDGQRRPAGERA